MPLIFLRVFLPNVMNATYSAPLQYLREICIEKGRFDQDSDVLCTKRDQMDWLSLVKGLKNIIPYFTGCLECLGAVLCILMGKVLPPWEGTIDLN